MWDFQLLTTLYKNLSLIVTTDISTRIYQPYLVTLENAPQEVSIDAI